MNLETRKLNMINWISIQEEEVLVCMVKIQKERKDWWSSVGWNDERAINEGLRQLCNIEYCTRSELFLSSGLLICEESELRNKEN